MKRIIKNMVKFNTRKIEDIIIDDTSEIILSPDQYLHIYNQGGNNIIQSTFMPPKLGEESFGNFLVRLKANVINSAETELQ
jgi:hypothetical protein